MNQHASNNSVPPSVGVDVSGIETLLNRNLPEVFGEGDPARRRSAIGELYTEDCVLYVSPGTFVGHDALDKFAGDLRATHPHYVYTPHGSPQGSAQFGTPGVGLGAERRNARLHRCGFHHRPGQQDRGSLCLPRLAAHTMREQNLA
jgi:hypothetical protein